MAEQQIRGITERFLSHTASTGWDEFVTGDYVMIRPTGNPVDKNGLIAMMDNKDVVIKTRKCLDVHRVRMIGDNYAVVVASEFAEFSYKDIQNVDVATHTMIFKKCDGSWKVMWQLRAVGRARRGRRSPWRTSARRGWRRTSGTCR